MDKRIGTILDKLKDKNVLPLSDPSTLRTIKDFVSSQCLPLDLIMTKGGGFPVGRMTEIFGNYSSGKSILAFQALAETQAREGLAVLADTESAAFPDNLLANLGINSDSLLYYTPDTVQEVFVTLDMIIDQKNREFGQDHLMTFVWDSVAATTTAAELEENYEDQSYPSAARVLSKVLRINARKFSESYVCLIFINQAKEKLNARYGSTPATFGGRSVAFHSSLRLDLRIISKITVGKGKDKIGVNIKVRVEKNKVGPPEGVIEIPIYFGHGVNEAEAVLNMMKKYKVVSNSGGWYTLDDLKFTRKQFNDLYYQDDDMNDYLSKCLEDAYYKAHGYEVHENE